MAIELPPPGLCWCPCRVGMAVPNNSPADDGYPLANGNHPADTNDPISRLAAQLSRAAQQIEAIEAQLADAGTLDATFMCQVEAQLDRQIHQLRVDIACVIELTRRVYPADIANDIVRLYNAHRVTTADEAIEPPAANGRAIPGFPQTALEIMLLPGNYLPRISQVGKVQRLTNVEWKADYLLAALGVVPEDIGSLAAKRARIMEDCGIVHEMHPVPREG